MKKTSFFASVASLLFLQSCGTEDELARALTQQKPKTKTSTKGQTRTETVNLPLRGVTNCVLSSGQCPGYVPIPAIEAKKTRVTMKVLITGDPSAWTELSPPITLASDFKFSGNCHIEECTLTSDLACQNQINVLDQTDPSATPPNRADRNFEQGTSVKFSEDADADYPAVPNTVPLATQEITVTKDIEKNHRYRLLCNMHWYLLSWIAPPNANHPAMLKTVTRELLE